jgi:hypothetical protein
VIRKIALCAGIVCTGLLALGVSPSGAVDAQSAPPGQDAGVPPYEVLTSVRSMGLEPLTRPVRNGAAYALRAFDPSGQEVRVVVDARRGRVLHVSPLGPRYGVMPAPYGRPPGRIPMVPDGYGPSSRIAEMPPGAEGPAVYGPGAGAVPPPHAPAAAVAPHPSSAQAGPPPLPRPRPKVATAETPAAAKPEAGPAVVQQVRPARDAAKDASKDAKASETTGTTAAPAAPAPAAAAPVELQE